MKKLFLCALIAATVSPLSAQAAKEKLTPATHMWIRTSLNSVIHVPTTSKEQCIILAKQTAKINSSYALCYDKEELLAEVNCQKPTNPNSDVSCRIE